jgi:hypothetical protein
MDSSGHAQLSAPRHRRQHANPSPWRRNLKPTQPASAVQISDADRKRNILITDKCTMTLKKWREKGESPRVA